MKILEILKLIQLLTLLKLLFILYLFRVNKIYIITGVLIMGKVIMFANQKGGVGKTTTAFETAYLLAEDKKVLMIDLDAQCNLTDIVGAEYSKSQNIFNCLSGVTSFEDSIIRVRENRELYIIPGSRKTLSQYFVSSDDLYLLKEAMNYIYEVISFDYVIIDVGPEAGQLMTMSMLASDYIVAVTGLSQLAYKGIVQMVSDIKTNRERYKGFNVKPLGILINSSKRNNVSAVNRERYYELAESFGAEPFKTEIKNSCVIDECKEFEMALAEYKPYHEISFQYKKLIKEMEERMNG